MTEHSKLPRLYVEVPLAAGQAVALTEAQGHYLRNVLRRSAGDGLRLFNGRDGEWFAALETPTKKVSAALPQRQLRPQTNDGNETHLLFTPLKKEALDFLVIKSTELGVTHLHPVLTQNTDARRVNADRVGMQIIEAAEQCERLDLPQLTPLRDLQDKLTEWPPAVTINAALERYGASPLHLVTESRIAFLIGPEGGFTETEKNGLASLPFVRAVSLGDSILRAETAALYCLSARRIGLSGR